MHQPDQDSSLMVMHSCNACAGKAITWGIESEWTLKWGLDGGFFEQFKNEEFTHEWGHDGKLTWYADAAGRVLRLELDEGEVSTLHTLMYA